VTVTEQSVHPPSKESSRVSRQDNVSGWFS